MGQFIFVLQMLRSCVAWGDADGCSVNYRVKRRLPQ